MKNSRNALTLLVGVLAAACALMLLGFSGLMYVLNTPARTCLVIGCTSLFPALIAVACLMPSKRTVAVRCIGAIVCVAAAGTLIVTFVAPPGGAEKRQRRGVLVVMAIAGGAMAVKGKWPGASESNPTAAEQAPVEEVLDRPI